MLVQTENGGVRLVGDGLSLFLDQDLARRVAAASGAVEERRLRAPEADDFFERVLNEDHDLWNRANGGDRNEEERKWREGDAPLAAAAYELFASKARRMLDLMKSEPGRQFTAKEIVEALDLTVEPTESLSSVLAGTLKGFTKGCRDVGRTLPFYWWKQGRGRPTLYAMRPSVAAVFTAAVG